MSRKPMKNELRDLDADDLTRPAPVGAANYRYYYNGFYYYHYYGNGRRLRRVTAAPPSAEAKGGKQVQKSRWAGESGGPAVELRRSSSV